jgi:hypothetical protein
MAVPAVVVRTGTKQLAGKKVDSGRSTTAARYCFHHDRLGLARLDHQPTIIIIVFETRSDNALGIATRRRLGCVVDRGKGLAPVDRPGCEETILRPRYSRQPNNAGYAIMASLVTGAAMKMKKRKA